MTKDIIESKLIYFLQRKVGIYNEDNKLLKSGKLNLVNIRDYTIQFTFIKPQGGNFSYEIPYPYYVTVCNNNLLLDYKLRTLSHTDDILDYKFIIHKPTKKNKFYDTVITLKEL